MDKHPDGSPNPNAPHIPTVDFEGFLTPGPARDKVVSDLMRAVTSVGTYRSAMPSGNGPNEL